MSRRLFGCSMRRTRQAGALRTGQVSASPVRAVLQLYAFFRRPVRKCTWGWVCKAGKTFLGVDQKNAGDSKGTLKRMWRADYLIDAECLCQDDSVKSKGVWIFRYPTLWSRPCLLDKRGADTHALCSRLGVRTNGRVNSRERGMTPLFVWYVDAECSPGLFTWSSLFFSLMCNFIAPIGVYILACTKIPPLQRNLQGKRGKILFNPHLRRNVQVR